MLTWKHCEPRLEIPSSSVAPPCRNKILVSPEAGVLHRLRGRIPQRLRCMQHMLTIHLFARDANDPTNCAAGQATIYAGYCPIGDVAPVTACS